MPTDSLLELVFTAGECANRFTAGGSVHSRSVLTDSVLELVFTAGECANRFTGRVC